MPLSAERGQRAKMEQVPKSVEQAISMPISEQSSSRMTIKPEDALTIDDLFNVEPEKLTEAHIDKFISVMRERRSEWEREEAAKNAGGRKVTKAAAGAPKKKVGKISLDDVQLDLDSIDISEL